MVILQEELVSPLSPFATHSIAQSPEGAVGQRGSTKPPLGGLAGQSLRRFSASALTCFGVDTGLSMGRPSSTPHVPRAETRTQAMSGQVRCVLVFTL